LRSANPPYGLRKEDKEERDERESLLDLYMRAMETATPEKAAKAA